VSARPRRRPIRQPRPPLRHRVAHEPRRGRAVPELLEAEHEAVAQVLHDDVPDREGRPQEVEPVGGGGGGPRGRRGQEGGAGLPVRRPGAEVGEEDRERERVVEELAVVHEAAPRRADTAAPRAGSARGGGGGFPRGCRRGGTSWTRRRWRIRPFQDASTAAAAGSGEQIIRAARKGNCGREGGEEAIIVVRPNGLRLVVGDISRPGISFVGGREPKTGFHGRRLCGNSFGFVADAKYSSSLCFFSSDPS
jgi:hypothetical protein